MAARTKGLADIVTLMAKTAGTALTPVRVFKAEDLELRTVITTGQDSFDRALGIGGHPTGRIIIYHGANACGKTTAALQVGCEFQDEGGVVIFLDFESKLDLVYVASLGIDLATFVYANPAHIEEAFEIVEATTAELRRSAPDAPVLVIWDSIHSAPSKAVFDGKWDDANWAREARVYSNGLRVLARKLAEADILMIAISQKRIKMDGGFASNKIAVGNAWPHHATVIVVWKAKKSKKVAVKGKAAESPYEDWTLEIKKNQVGVPYRTCELRMVYGEGFDPCFSTFVEGVRSGVIAKKGAWYAYGETKLGQGIDNSIETLRDNLELWGDLRAELREAFEPEEDEDAG